MPGLIVRNPDGATSEFKLIKRLTSIGSGADNDLTLDDPRIPPHALHILKEGEGYRVASQSTSFLVNGRSKTEHVLTEQDVLELGAVRISFFAGESGTGHPEGRDPRGDELESRDLAALRRLTQFSEALLQSDDVDRLLERLMDEVIGVTRADKGLILLLDPEEPGRLRVQVARNVDRQNIEDALTRVSDSIVAKVLKTRRALIISDALDDPEFKASESVVNLRLMSVMCVPLINQGELFGLIYVGNDRLAHRFEVHALDTLTIFAAQASLILQNAMLLSTLREDNQKLRQELGGQRYGEIVGACPGMREVYRKVDKIAATDLSVLITGETGTGKELIAREIHRHSPRAKGPFITVNCGAIPENLLESELFGHVRGAFTGAVSTRPGKFQAAIGGSLFLDEIGELPLALQVKLLRALQEKVVYKVGETRPDPVDIRILTATNKILEQEVRKGTFREDLYYRLNVVSVPLPPLRERGDDVVVLSKFFLLQHAKELNTKCQGFTPAAIKAIKRHHWPGNVRELENRIKKAIVLSEKALIGPEDLDLGKQSLAPVVPLAQAKEDFQKRYIDEVLERNGGNRTKTARDLGVDPRTVFRHLEKHDGASGDEEEDAAK